LVSSKIFFFPGFLVRHGIDFFVFFPTVKVPASARRLWLSSPRQQSQLRPLPNYITRGSNVLSSKSFDIQPESL
jgi:hypothetical protein